MLYLRCLIHDAFEKCFNGQMDNNESRVAFATKNAFQLISTELFSTSS